MAKHAASVILSTYRSETWLLKVLWSYHCQIVRNFELIIADDGSGPETRKLLDSFLSITDIPIRHIWHEDDGFRKCAILNKAILAANPDYLILSDGDCMARADFVKTHLKKRKPGYFLSGGCFRLSMEVSHRITPGDIQSGVCFRPA